MLGGGGNTIENVLNAVCLKDRAVATDSCHFIFL